MNDTDSNISLNTLHLVIYSYKYVQVVRVNTCYYAASFIVPVLDFEVPEMTHLSHFDCNAMIM